MALQKECRRYIEPPSRRESKSILFHCRIHKLSIRLGRFYRYFIRYNEGSIESHNR